MCASPALPLSSSYPLTNREPESRANPPQGKNYLERCVEEITSSEALAKTNDRYATAYKVAAFAVIGLFIVAAAAAVIVTGIYAPIFVPITMMSIICLTNPALTVIKHLLANVQINKICAERTRAIAKEYQDIKATPQSNIDATIALVRLAPSRIDEYDAIKPLLAHYNYWDKLQKEKDSQTIAKIAEARALPAKESVEKYLEASALRQEALVAKISKAFLIAVMNHLEFHATADDLCSLRDFSIPATLAEKTLNASLESNEWAQHALLREFGDTRADDFLVFKSPDNRISFNEAITFTDDQIAQRFLQEMRAIPAS